MGLKSAWLLVVFLFLGVAVAENVDKLNIWPMPKWVSKGHKRVYLSPDFELDTDGSKYSDGSGILKDGFTRMLDVVKVAHVVDGNLSSVDKSFIIKGIHVVIFSPGDQLQYGVDESYKLLVPSPEMPDHVHLEAQTVYGALHGLQTFSQLCHFNLRTKVIEVPMVPWTIIDQPRFSYRGLLIASGNNSDSCSINKTWRWDVDFPCRRCYKVDKKLLKCKTPVIGLYEFTLLHMQNVLHWHIVDTQSFPLEMPSYPKLWDGAYSVSERYTFSDAAEIVRQVAGQ
ncbi:unnamed protein product [Dovyalis caffra]|uniref:beta-N-acetylhexosaminidase n=1 Tax=Dovyalis caffra TaxID=77055 RepID=A0AAV1QYX4_9ROSI|nr:unnamed protein product [Dovyalis caffra]